MNDILWLISTSLENIVIVIMYRKISNKELDKQVIKGSIFVIANVIETLIYSTASSYFSGVFNDFFGTITYFLFGVCFITFIYKEKFFDAFLYYFFSECILIFLELPSLIVVNLLRLAIKASNMYLFALVGALLTLVLGVELYRHFPEKIINKYRTILNKLKFIFFNLILYIFIIRFLLFYDSTIFDKYYIIISIISFLYAAINIMSVIYNYKIEDQKMKLETYDKYTPIILELMNEVKTRQHDFKNHINTIYGIVQTSNNENLKKDLEEYIISLNNSFKGMDEVIRIDNRVVAASIYSKQIFAKQNKIKFLYNIECSLKAFPLENYEISEVLSNLIDNALQAVADEEEKFRSVELQMGYGEGKYFIETRNTGFKIKTNEINKIFNRGFSTKGSSNHGYGLYNVKKIVEKHNGYLEVSIEDKYLIIKLYIPQKAFI